MKKPFIRRFTKKIFILSNFVIAILFIAGASVKYLNPEKWWFFSLFTFLLPYLLFFLILFFLFWLLVKPAWSLVSVVAVIISFHAVKSIFPLNFSSFSIEKPTNTFRVMSWNVEFFNILNHKEHPEKKDQMLELINQYNPDIACFQEVVAGENKGAINYLPGILDTLKFKNYLYSYRIENNFDQEHHYGILVVSKFPILRKQTIVNNPNDYNSTYQFIDVLIGTDTVRVFNVHLQSLKFSADNKKYLDKGPDKNEKNYEESVNIIDKIKNGIIKRASQAFYLKDEMNHSPYPIILCGDFNDVPVSYAYETIGEGLQNAFVQKGSGISRTYNSISPTLRIDNIFADKFFTINQFDRIKVDLSDHFPIVADMKLG
ncbi:MAG: endonuclease/exonuclease/phosphatase family protein, partial [Ginsengibacter sp.]